MANSYKKQSRGLISNALGVAKKLTNTGVDLISTVAPGSVAKLNHPPKDDEIIEGKVKESQGMEQKKFENPQQMIREHFPKVTQQILGRHYNKVNNVAHFISPDLNHKIADYFFDKLDDFASSISSVNHVLKEVGAKNLEELAKDPARSSRISQALANQNKLIAALQGAVTGASGVIGTAIDIPSSLTLTLRAIYQTGRAHGFELNRESEQGVVEYIFRQVDLATLAEKQTLLVGLRTIANVVETQNVQQLQSLLGSSNDFSVIQNWLSNQDGGYKWTWLNSIPKISILSKLTPLAGAGIGAVYSWKLIDDANKKAEEVFAQAQQYRLQHPNEQVDIIEAYEKSQALFEQASPVLLKQPEVSTANLTIEFDTVQTEQSDNQVITEVRIEHKPEEKPEIESISEGLKKLAATHVESNTEATTQSPQDKTESKSKITTRTPKAQVEKSRADTKAKSAPVAKKPQVSAEKAEKNAVVKKSQATEKTNEKNEKSPDSSTPLGAAKVITKAVKLTAEAVKDTAKNSDADASSLLTKKAENPKPI